MALPRPRSPRLSLASMGVRLTERSLVAVRESGAVVVLSLGVLTTLSLLSYAPSDSSLNQAPGQAGAAVQNWIGPVGALWADLCLQIMGVSAWLFDLALLVSGSRLMLGRRGQMTRRQFFALAGLLTSVGTLVELLLVGNRSSYPLGGVLGALLARTLRELFAPVGAATLAATGAVLSLTVCLGGVLSSLAWRLQAQLDGWRGRASARTHVALRQARVRLAPAQLRALWATRDARAWLAAGAAAEAAARAAQAATPAPSPVAVTQAVSAAAAPPAAGVPQAQAADPAAPSAPATAAAALATLGAAANAAASTVAAEAPAASAAATPHVGESIGLPDAEADPVRGDAALVDHRPVAEPRAAQAATAETDQTDASATDAGWGPNDMAATLAQEAVAAEAEGLHAEAEPDAMLPLLHKGAAGVDDALATPTPPDAALAPAGVDVMHTAEPAWASEMDDVPAEGASVAAGGRDVAAEATGATEVAYAAEAAGAAEGAAAEVAGTVALAGLGVAAAAAPAAFSRWDAMGVGELASPPDVAPQQVAAGSEDEAHARADETLLAALDEGRLAEASALTQAGEAADADWQTGEGLDDVAAAAAAADDAEELEAALAADEVAMREEQAMATATAVSTGDDAFAAPKDGLADAVAAEADAALAAAESRLMAEVLPEAVEAVQAATDAEGDEPMVLPTPIDDPAFVAEPPETAAELAAPVWGTQQAASEAPPSDDVRLTATEASEDEAPALDQALDELDAASAAAARDEAAMELGLADEDAGIEEMAAADEALQHALAAAPGGTNAGAGAAAIAVSAAAAHSAQAPYVLPPLDLLHFEAEERAPIDPAWLQDNAARLTKTLADYGIDGHVREIRPGPVVTMYEYVPGPGIKLAKIASLADDLAMSMQAFRVRIVAPIPGKGAVGIEIPNDTRELVHLKEIVGEASFVEAASPLTMALGKDIEGTPCSADLARMPHLLVAGATGAGKSVSVNAMIMSVLFKSSPRQVRMIMVDPKMLELSVYEGIPHLLLPVVTDPRKAAVALRWAVQEMERRYELLSEIGVRSIEGYNARVQAGEAKGEPLTVAGADPALPRRACEELPYLLVIVDELADLMMVAPREVEGSIMRLAQMARAAGIHLILATQRPSVDVLTGVIKANFPTRIAFQVASRHDSRTIIDANGAEHLLGRGDMLYMASTAGGIKRVHGAYVSEEDIERTVNFVRNQAGPTYDETILLDSDDDRGTDDVLEEGHDEMYDQAVAIVAESQQASISMIQRRLRIGYNRAARMVECMEGEGIVGPGDGAKPREVFVQPS